MFLYLLGISLPFHLVYLAVSVVPFYCEDFTQWVGLDDWLVKVSWFWKLVSMFWSVEMDFFYLECNGVPSDEFCNGFVLGVTLGSLHVDT